MDGTLISSFTPARAPVLPADLNTYIVGRGSKINPKGVFVVERPGLAHFFKELGKFAGAILTAAMPCDRVCFRQSEVQQSEAHAVAAVKITLRYLCVLYRQFCWCV